MRRTENDKFRVLQVVLYLQEVINMDITTEEYRLLFNSITDAIEHLELLRDGLIQAQIRAEEIVITSGGEKQAQLSIKVDSWRRRGLQPVYCPWYYCNRRMYRPHRAG